MLDIGFVFCFTKQICMVSRGRRIKFELSNIMQIIFICLINYLFENILLLSQSSYAIVIFVQKYDQWTFQFSLKEAIKNTDFVFHDCFPVINRRVRG